MNQEEYEYYYHVDIATQIENNWNEDTALGIVKDSRKFSVLIKARDKETLKRRFIQNDGSDSDKKHNKRVVALIYSYLLYNAIAEFPEANPLLLCRDVRPEHNVMQYWQKICSYYKNQKVRNRVIKFRKREDRRDEKLPKSLAGRYVRKVFQGNLSPNKTISKEELEELINLISKLL